MNNTVISVDHLSKSYVLHHQKQERYIALRDVIAAKTKSIFKKKDDFKSKEEFVALNDISFDVKQGERLGIIGRNGAGKSTLLKILSRIVTPTKGQAVIEGRVASLLEVGTGFHPELTGRENIFLNGSILGMSRSEIVRKFDEIVAFSEVEKFLDTPVKRYSSGMYVRLAFAVAAHLEPEILIVDEVLAVGDVQFQRKCLGKMEDISKNDGRTVLFVSHNMGAIASLCSRGMVLNKGTLTFHGEINEAISHYLKSSVPNADSLNNRTDRKGNGLFKFTDIDFKNKDGHPINEIFSGDELKINLGFTAGDSFNFSQLLISIAIMDETGSIAASFVSDEMGVDFSYLASEKQIELQIPEVMLRPGMYLVRLFASSADTTEDSICDLVENAATFTIMPVDYWKSGKPIRKGNYSLLKASFLK